MECLYKLFHETPLNANCPVYNRNWQNSVAFHLSTSSWPLGFLANSWGKYCTEEISLAIIWATWLLDNRLLALGAPHPNYEKILHYRNAYLMHVIYREIFYHIHWQVKKWTANVFVVFFLCLVTEGLICSVYKIFCYWVGHSSHIFPTLFTFVTPIIPWILFDALNKSFCWCITNNA